MAPRRLKESIIFLVNIGMVRHGTPSNTQLLDKTKFILKHIIQKKIFLRPKDEIGVILMGSTSGKDDSAIKFDNIHELCSMQVGNWELIENIDKLQTTDHICSWMEAIYAAIDYIKYECPDKSERKIMLLSDFNEEAETVNQFEMNDIIKELHSEEILLIAIGERALDNIDKSSQTASEALLMNILRKIGGQYFTFEQAMSDVRFYRPPSKKSMPWYCDMELGDFHIPIIGTARIPRDMKLPKLRYVSTSSETNQQVSIKKVVQWIDKNRTIYKKEDVIRGYVYGGKSIPVTDYDKQNMNPKNNAKRYRIHGFTARKNVPMEYWLSDGTYVIVPADESVSAPFYSLVQAMIEQNVIAIAEKVYRKNCHAKMIALFPNIDVPSKPWTLIEIGLPFEQDAGTLIEKSLSSMMQHLSKEQNDVIDNLLMSLELPDITDDDASSSSDRYLPGRIPNPRTQHMWDMLSFRALNRDQPLPSAADEIKNLLKQPASVKEKCEPVAAEIKNLFFLEKKKHSKSKKGNEAWKKNENDVPIIQLENNGEQLENKEKENNGDNNEANNMISSSDPFCDFDFDQIADI